MIVLNNRGQSLVLFVLLLPLLLFVGIIVIDCGRVMVEKKELDIVSEMVVRYGASNIDSDNVENKIVSLYDLNICFHFSCYGHILLVQGSLIFLIYSSCFLSDSGLE